MTTTGLQARSGRCSSFTDQGFSFRLLEVVDEAHLMKGCLLAWFGFAVTGKQERKEQTEPRGRVEGGAEGLDSSRQPTMNPPTHHHDCTSQEQPSPPLYRSCQAAARPATLAMSQRRQAFGVSDFSLTPRRRTSKTILPPGGLRLQHALTAAREPAVDHPFEPWAADGLTQTLPIDPPQWHRFGLAENERGAADWLSRPPAPITIEPCLSHG